MIPSYKGAVEAPAVPAMNPDDALELRFKQLTEQVHQLRDSIEYMNRERNRLKSEVEQLKNFINRQ